MQEECCQEGDALDLPPDTAVNSERYWCGHPSVEIVEGQVFYYSSKYTERLLRHMQLEDTIERNFASKYKFRVPNVGNYCERDLEDRTFVSPCRETSPNCLVALLVADVPHHMSPAELTEFISMHHGSVDSSPNCTGLDFVKVLHSPSPTSYFCLLFCYANVVFSLYKAVNGQPYNPLEAERCHLHLVKKMTAEISLNKLDRVCTVSAQTNAPCENSVIQSNSPSETPSNPKMSTENNLLFDKSPHSCAHGTGIVDTPESVLYSQAISNHRRRGSFSRPSSRFVMSKCRQSFSSLSQAVSVTDDVRKDGSSRHLSPEMLRRFDRMVEDLFQVKEKDFFGLPYLPSDFSNSPPDTPRLRNSPCCQCDVVPSYSNNNVPVDSRLDHCGAHSFHNGRNTTTLVENVSGVGWEAAVPAFCACSCHAQPSAFHVLSQSRSVPDDCMTAAFERRLEVLQSNIRIDRFGNVWEDSLSQRGTGTFGCTAENSRDALPCDAKRSRSLSDGQSTSSHHSSIARATSTTWSCSISGASKDGIPSRPTNCDEQQYARAGAPSLPRSSRLLAADTAESPFALLTRYECPAYCAVCLEKVVWSSLAAHDYDMRFDDTPGESTLFCKDNATVSATDTQDVTERFLNYRALPSCDAPRPADIPINILCGHTFHAECLLRWYDASCPYCRYQQYPCKTSCCAICGRNDHIKMCLVCGFLGCDAPSFAAESDSQSFLGFPELVSSDPLLTASSPVTRHAYQHFVDFQHLYALEVETQRVWDFSRRSFVHRLLHNRSDGKVVEVAHGTEAQFHPNTPLAKLSEETSAHRSKGICEVTDVVVSDDTASKKQRDVENKVKNLVFYFNDTIRRQLDAQRHQFSERMRVLYASLDELHAEVEQRRETLRDALNVAQNRFATLKLHVQQVCKTKEQEKKITLVEDRKALIQQLDKLKALHARLTQSVINADNAERKEKEDYAILIEQRENTIKNLQAQIDDVQFHLRTQRELVATEMIQSSSFVIGQRVASRPTRRAARARQPRRSRQP